MAREVPFKQLIRAVATLSGLIGDDGHIVPWHSINDIELRVNRTLELLGGRYDPEKDRVENG